ncbi:MAG: hypothetical protein SOV63_04165 [Pyramidobacter porci]|nr:hypothetical protein [Pyramidobacter sp.]MDY2647984.1 hypothetical protein [Pyramidobacter porci]
MKRTFPVETLVIHFDPEMCGLLYHEKSAPDVLRKPVDFSASKTPLRNFVTDKTGPFIYTYLVNKKPSPQPGNFGNLSGGNKK